MDKLSWSAPEYEEKERGNDWFWALGIIVVTSAVAAVIFTNYFFALLLLLGGTLLGFFSIRKPEIVVYELDEKGLKIREQLYPYEKIKSFWVQKEKVEDGRILKPTLFIKSERIFMPIISVPIEEDLADRIRSVLISKNVPEEEMREHASEKIMEFLGF